MSLTRLPPVCFAAVVFACGGSSAIEDDTHASGTCMYQDAQTDANGAPAEPERPPAQTMQIEIDVRGAGALDGLEPQCEVEGATGQFTGLLKGTGEVDGSGLYLAAFAFGEGTFTTPSGTCRVPALTVSSITQVTVRARLDNTTANCRGYCDAKARGYAEGECAGNPDQSGCRADAGAEYTTSCQAACDGSTTRTIAAEASLGVDALAEINASQLGVSGLGTLEASLMFATVRESNDEIVSEDPAGN